MHWKKAKACRSIRAGIGAAAEEAAELVWLVFALKLVSHEDKAASAGTTNKKKRGKKTKQKKKTVTVRRQQESKGGTLDRWLQLTQLIILPNKRHFHLSEVVAEGHQSVPAASRATDEEAAISHNSSG